MRFSKVINSVEGVQIIQADVGFTGKEIDVQDLISDSSTFPITGKSLSVKYRAGVLHVPAGNWVYRTADERIYNVTDQVFRGSFQPDPAEPTLHIFTNCSSERLEQADFEHDLDPLSHIPGTGDAVDPIKISRIQVEPMTFTNIPEVSMLTVQDIYDAISGDRYLLEIEKPFRNEPATTIPADGDVSVELIKKWAAQFKPDVTVYRVTVDSPLAAKYSKGAVVLVCDDGACLETVRMTEFIHWSRRLNGFLAVDIDWVSKRGLHT